MLPQGPPLQILPSTTSPEGGSTPEWTTKSSSQESEVPTNLQWLPTSISSCPANGIIAIIDYQLLLESDQVGLTHTNVGYIKVCGCQTKVEKVKSFSKKRLFACILNINFWPTLRSPQSRYELLSISHLLYNKGVLNSLLLYLPGDDVDCNC